MSWIAQNWAPPLLRIQFYLESEWFSDPYYVQAVELCIEFAWYIVARKELCGFYFL